jgi:predicted MFS family arabinose efflux permease
MLKVQPSILHAAGLEDGTLGYLNIAALKYGFQLLASLGGMKVKCAVVAAPCLRTALLQLAAMLCKIISCRLQQQWLLPSCYPGCKLERKV